MKYLPQVILNTISLFPPVASTYSGRKVHCIRACKMCFLNELLRSITNKDTTFVKPQPDGGCLLASVVSTWHKQTYLTYDHSSDKASLDPDESHMLRTPTLSSTEVRSKVPLFSPISILMLSSLLRYTFKAQIKMPECHFTAVIIKQW